MNKKEIKDSQTVLLKADFIRNSVLSDLYSVFGEPVWFKRNDIVSDTGTEIEIPLKLAKKKFPNENF